MPTHLTVYYLSNQWMKNDFCLMHFLSFDTTEDPSYMTEISGDKDARLGNKGKNPFYSVLYLSNQWQMKNDFCFMHFLSFDTTDAPSYLTDISDERLGSKGKFPILQCTISFQPMADEE